MIKLILKLAVVALVANATWRVGSAYLAHYKFTDAIEQTTTFKGNVGSPGTELEFAL